MKKNFIQRMMQLLEKEVCQDEAHHAHELPAFFHQLKAYTANKHHEAVTKHLNIASKSLKSQETVLNEGVTVKGELQFDKQLRINGSFEGNLCSKGRVIIGPKGTVKGNIELDEAEVYGKVLGNISVKKLTLGAKAEILGDIEATSLNIEKGAKLTGHLKIHPDDIDDHLVFISKEEVFEEQALSSAS